MGLSILKLLPILMDTIGKAYGSYFRTMGLSSRGFLETLRSPRFPHVHALDTKAWFDGCHCHVEEVPSTSSSWGWGTEHRYLLWICPSPVI